MRRVPVNIVGPNYEDRARSYSVQSTVNLYPSRPIEGRSLRKLQRFPNCRRKMTADGANRSNLKQMGNLVYRVRGTALCGFDSSFAETEYGTIPGTNRCHLETDGVHLVVSTGSARYQLTGSTLTQFTDVDHKPGNTSAFLNQRMIYDAAGTGQVQFPDLNDPDDINALNVATAESSPDDTLAVKVFKERLLMAGELTVEPWYNDGSADFPPYSRIEGGTHQFGLGAIHSMANDESFVYMLSSNNHIYRMTDIQAQRITPVVMERFLEDNETSDALGWCQSYAGQWFYWLTFPTANKTWVIPVDNPADAFTLSSDLVGGRHLASAYIYAFGRHLVADYRNGNIHELDESVLKDDGENVLVERTIAPLNGEPFRQPGAEVTANEFGVIMETGIGNADDPDPVAMFELTTDGGRSFTNESRVKMGQAGEQTEVLFHFVKTFRDAAVRFRCVDPVPISIHSAFAMMEIVE